MTTRNDVFENVKIGETFYCGGNTCRKRSTRTADVDTCGGTYWYWFTKDTPVTVG